MIRNLTILSGLGLLWGLMVFQGRQNTYRSLPVADHTVYDSRAQKPSTVAGYQEAQKPVTYMADITRGFIGTSDRFPADDPYDNVFHIQLPVLPAAGEVAYLQYRLYGVANHTGVARSINDAQAIGAHFVRINKDWSDQQEAIAAATLHKGDNVVRFSLPADAAYHYEVKDVRIVIQKQASLSNIILINQPDRVFYGDSAYLKGILQLPAEEQAGAVQLYCNDDPVAVHNNEFEVVMRRPAMSQAAFTARLKAVLPGGKIITRTVDFTSDRRADVTHLITGKGIKKEAGYVTGSALKFSLDSISMPAAIDIPAHALPQQVLISITALREMDIPALNVDMINVTRGAAGYRFLPHGSRFSKPASLSIPFDSALIPEGYTAADVRSYYFDEQARRWMVLPLDTIMTYAGIVLSTTTHFTDMINGIIKVPESPQTQGYTPTSIKDFKAADPMEGITLINPPTATSTGNASMGFSLKLPAGRLGIQPAFTIQYNNEGGNGWMGFGWNMSVPAVGIETRWGAPRYDAARETENYMLNGEQLAPVVHRTALVTREADKQFYPRVEGAFNKIIRHGSHPSNYWWEVVEKSGTRNFYGGTPSRGVMNEAVLKDELGNIGHWALAETRDLNDNFVRYVYEMVIDYGIDGGSVPGKQLYLSEVIYTGHGTTDGPYKVAFIRDRQLSEARRKDVAIDGRLGFKMVSADLLRKVTISFNNTLIRSYECKYEEGAFYKTLLKSISEVDDAGVVFYSHQLEYYDDVNRPEGYNPSAGVSQWSIASDGIKGDLINPIPGFTAEGSVLSTSKSSNRGGGLAVTLGSLAGGAWSKKLSVGGSFSYGEDDQEGLVSMVDINGDALPDKVFKKGNSLFYRANQGGTERRFGESRPIIGIDNFSAGNSRNTTGGVQVIPFTGFFGYARTSTTATTKVYLSDFNGDGLVDVASNGRVFFNHLNAQGNPEFTPSSTPTPSPIFTGSSIDASLLDRDLALQAEQEQQFPLQDVVRMWEAPFEGTVSITAPVQLQQIPNQSGIVNSRKDGVRASIQQGNNVRWSVVIPADDYSIKTPSNVTSFHVVKGERIYFRLQSRYNGVDDLVSWDPVIEYAAPLIPATDANHRASTYYRASDDFILHSTSSTGMGKNGEIIIDGRFKKGVTTDTVTVQIIRKRNNATQVVFAHSYAEDEVVDIDLQVPGRLQVLAQDEFYFQLVARSYIDRSVLQWKPHFRYVTFTDNTPVTNSQGVPTLQGDPVPDNTNYNHWLIAAAPMSVSRQDTVVIWPRVTGDASASGNLWLTVKINDTVYARRRIQVTGGVMNAAIDSIHLIRKVNEPVFIEYATDTLAFALKLQPTGVITYKDSSFIDIISGQPDTITLTDTLQANLYTNPGQEFLGPLFRGWGHFALKGDKGDGPLDQSILNLDELNNYPTDPDAYDDSTSISQLPDPSKANFMMLFPNAVKHLWAGYDSSVYVTGQYMSSSRLWMHDVYVEPLMAGEALGAAHKVSTTKSNSYSAGPGPIGSVGVSNATTTVKLDMMDMNGDRYPDVLNDHRVQYTLPNGGLGADVIAQGTGLSVNEGNSKGVSFGGTFLEAATENSTKRGAVDAQKTASFSAGISGSVNENKDNSNSSWTDINGDGLPDRVYKDGRVALNLGYRFAPAEQWGIQAIDASKTTAVGAGMGINIDAGSWQAGFGLSRSTGENSFTLNDINGDGLPDQLSQNGGVLTVRLNTGNGFGPAFVWKAFNAITANISTGESLNAAYTWVIPIYIFGIKICINPSVSVGHGVSRQQDQIMDMDGDGYPDLVHSDNDGQLTASASTIGRTNMLRKVQGPLRSSFTLDYERMGNTYAMPQSKWVLKSVDIYDGVAGDGVDTMRHRYSYEGGYHDRHEREFYGFSKVVSHQLNTADHNMVYRRRVQQFLNTTYYTKGLLASEWLEDAAGNKFTQTNNLYDTITIQEHVKYPALKQTEKLFYEGQATIGTRTATRFDYDRWGNVTHISDAGDGSQQDMILADITYHDIDHLYVKSVPASIEVTTAEGLKRRRTTTVNATGDIIRIQQFLADGTAPSTDMEYDSYGNLAKLTRPENHKKQRMWYSYEYDNAVHSYVTKVTDAFGYTSSSTYDYRFGALTGTVSMNDEPMQYKLDNRGRLVMLTGPYELAAGKPYTIAFGYNTTAPVPYAVTRHYDPEYNSDIITLSFADGLGRPIQVKKQVALFKGKGVGDELRLVVSGKVLYDAFGRAEKTFYPTTEAIGAGIFNLNDKQGNISSVTTYDVQDRPLRTVLADGATSSTTYSIVDGFFSTMVTDALNNRKETQTDVRGRKRFTKDYGGPDGTITTRFDYNALSELLRVVDNKGNAIVHTYDNLGRKLSLQHPDAGLTTFAYDPAGNLLRKVTAQVRKEIPNGGAIQYQYDYERLTDIDYPRHYQNKVKYTYGAAGSGSRAGRMTLQQDASGGQEFFYGKLGEVTKVIRTVLVSPIFATTYVSEQEYDTWNRVKKMIYPDGEEVRYRYNKAGGLRSIEGHKLGNTYKYVDQLGYDEFEQRVYLRYGNGTETRYAYDSLRRRLTQLQAMTPAGRAVMNNTYRYDAVSNILGIVNNVQAQQGKLGGYAEQEFYYDKLYRLDSASGRYKGAKDSSGYGIRLLYDNLYNIVRKKMSDSLKDHSYDHVYTYDGPAPHQATQIGNNKYSYDANGNQLGYGDMENFWDEENRLMAVLNKGKLNQYTYDAAGERVIKSDGPLQGIWVNGAPAGAVKHRDNYTAYVSPYIVCRRTDFTKHYYIENQRIASKRGYGTFTNISFPQPALTAGGVNYSKRAKEIEQSRLTYYAGLGVSPGPPTDKNFYARPENSGIAAPVVTDNTAADVPRGWPGNTTPPINGPPVFVNPIPSNDSVKAGYGFQGTGHMYEKDLYFYHPDHLGSTNYVTDILGEVNQHAEYSPFGETFFEEHSSSFTSPYLFNAKEKDPETGYYYYGARYYEPTVSQWLSVDPMADEYPALSPYNYCLHNPVKLTDPDGKLPVLIVVWAAYEIGSAAYDAYEAYKTVNDANATRGEKALAVAGVIMDVALPGGGYGKVLTKADDVVDAVKTLNKADDVVGAAKMVSKADDAVASAKKLEKAASLEKKFINAEQRAAKLSEKARDGKDFTKAGKEAVKDLNKAKNGGKMRCEGCGVEAQQASKHTKGQRPPDNEAHVDHITPKAKGGSGTPNNGQVLCRECNLKKGVKNE